MMNKLEFYAMSFFGLAVGIVFFVLTVVIDIAHMNPMLSPFDMLLAFFAYLVLGVVLCIFFGFDMNFGNGVSQ